MTDLNPDTPDKPIEVSASPVAAQASTGARDALLLVATLPALVAVFGKGNVTDIVNWFAGEQGLSFVALVIAVGTTLWRQWLARKKNANDVRMARSADDSVAVVKA